MVLIAHGAAEHVARYSRLAALLVDDGFAVYGIDHRGHGRTAARAGTPGVARPGGWEAMVDDLGALAERIAADRPGVPIVLFGHSMGSLLAQRALQRDDVPYAAVVLSGTSGSLDGADELIAMLQGIEAAEGPDAPSAVFAAMFAGFNEPFATTVADPTGYEWLSRDRDEVAAYVADPWCGGALSNGFVTDMVTGMAAMWEPAAEARIPRDLPILLIAGDADPVGAAGASVRALADRYEAAGRGPITCRLYPEARHELLNETNRDEVHADLRAWLTTTVPAH
ncbi:MAG: alpha/beta hydrolase [Acidimicrobiales bacterium]